jgi:transketolase
VQRVDWRAGHADSGEYHEDVEALFAALQAAKAETDRPSFISLRTIIAWPAPDAQNTGKAHGSALGADEVAATKKVLGLDPDKTFDVDPEVLAHARQVVERGRAAHAEWDQKFAAWAAKNTDGKALLDRMRTRTLPDGWSSALPEFPADAKGMATR